MFSYENVIETLGGVRALGRRVRSIGELEAAVGEGLPRRALDHVLEFLVPEDERPRFRNRVIPRASYQRSPRLSPLYSATTERLARIVALSRWLWEDDTKAKKFLWTSHPELGGRAPIEAALTELGARQVEEVIDRGVHGLPV